MNFMTKLKNFWNGVSNEPTEVKVADIAPVAVVEEPAPVVETKVVKPRAKKTAAKKASEPKAKKTATKKTAKKKVSPTNLG